jgi:hypothetical protein
MTWKLTIDSYWKLIVDAIQQFKFGPPREDFEAMTLTPPPIFSLAADPSGYQLSSDLSHFGLGVNADDCIAII